jgi:hypothetical protein
VGFEPTIPVSERAKTVHALDRAATVTSYIQGIPSAKKIYILSLSLYGFTALWTLGIFLVS